ncbi:MAG: hypothetical protein R6U51_08080 [Anaerolineales bacterium]
MYTTLGAAFNQLTAKRSPPFQRSGVTRGESPQGFTGIQTNAAQTPCKFMNETGCFTARLPANLPAQVLYKWSENNNAKFVHILHSGANVAYINNKDWKNGQYKGVFCS